MGGLSFKVRVKQNSSKDVLEKYHLEKGGLVQQTIDKSVIDWCLPYCPWDSGALAKGAYSATTFGSGKVIYPARYAHYMYYGEVYGPNIPVYGDDSGEPTSFFSPPGQKKHPTGRQLQYSTDVNALAGSHWFERMKADHAADILREAKDVAGLK